MLANWEKEHIENRSHYTSDALRNSRKKSQQALRDFKFLIENFDKFKDFNEVVTEDQLKYLARLLHQRNKGMDPYEGTTVWSFPVSGKGGDHRFAGHSPPQILENLLHFYTNPGDLVLDPMAGSGITIDVCERMEYPYKAYDLSPYHDKIEENDATKGIPLPDNNVDFVFWHPPYGNLYHYSRKKTDLSNVENFEELFEIVAEELYRVLKPGKYISVLIGNHYDKKAHKVIPHGVTTYNILAKYFTPQEEVVKTISGARSHTPLWQYRIQKSKGLLRGHEYIWIMKKILA